MGAGRRYANSSSAYAPVPSIWLPELQVLAPHLVLGCCCKKVPAVCIAQVDIQVLHRGAVTLLQGSDEVEMGGMLRMDRMRGVFGRSRP